ncbi:MAG: lantibiotic dehydratase [Deltaproteobacteria bacterium]|nr:lantibiotic dehydratase [Deltaproteobacteria bacterium]
MSTGAVLRTPALPLSAFTRWGDTARLDRSPDALRRELRAWIEQPRIRDALYVASPSLVESLHLLDSGHDSPRGQAVERAVVRYLARMCGRATPFGMFSGVCPVKAGGPRTSLSLGGHDGRRTRIDNDYMFRLLQALGRDARLRAEIAYRTNSSLYRVAGRIRYAEAVETGNGRQYRLVGVEPDAYLDRVLARAQAGATLDELIAALDDDDTEHDRDDARAFVEELIEAQLLESPLQVPVTGPEPLDGVIEQLDRTAAGRPYARVLDGVRQQLSTIDRRGPGVEPSCYEAVARQLEALPVEVERAHLFQVDMVRDAEATIDDPFVGEVLAAVEALHAIAARDNRSELDAFSRAFQARYGDREVPLLEALDDDVGVGFGAPPLPGGPAAPLLEGLGFPGRGGPSTASWSRAHTRLLLRLDALPMGAEELVLDADDVDAMRIEPAPAPLPDAFATVVSVAHVDGQRRVVMRSGAWGPSGARTSGRFCHLSPGIRRGVVEHLRAEEALRPDAVFAEIAHLSEGRVGNVLCRPTLRDHEIVLLGCSGAPADRQLSLDDLRVRIEQGRIVLRSARLDREVLPRLSTAHDFGRRSLAVYRLLGELQTQGTASGGFDWGPLSALPGLPRVRLGNAVLAVARWRLSAETLEPLVRVVAGKPVDAADTRSRRARAWSLVQQLRAEYGLPRLLTLVDGDNKLLVDLDNILSVYATVTLLRAGRDALFEEVYPGPDQLLAHSPAGGHVHELSLSFVRKPSVDIGAQPSRTVTMARAAVPRFDPGGPWLYVRLFGGAATHDEVLTEVIAPLTEATRRDGVCDRWFFLRYDDPAPHLRVRWHGPPQRLLAELLPALTDALAPWRSSGAVWKVELDGYEPEVERYGGSEAMGAVERLFEADSDAVLGMLGLVRDGGEALRWRLAMLGVDAMLRDFGLERARRLALLERVRDAFGQELGMGRDQRRQLGQRFRRERGWMQAALGDGAVSAMVAVHELLVARGHAAQPHIARLDALEAAHSLPSLLHMHCNRVLRAAPRHHELVIYDLLARYYRSELARDAKRGRTA